MASNFQFHILGSFNCLNLAHRPIFIIWTYIKDCVISLSPRLKHDLLIHIVHNYVSILRTKKREDFLFRFNYPMVSKRWCCWWYRRLCLKLVLLLFRLLRRRFKRYWSGEEDSDGDVAALVLFPDATRWSAEIFSASATDKLFWLENEPL